ncbi:MAG: sigma-70 family RNA polymerase sigma factor [bacterium]|nr:sigma-70 family RNA polymerase sigma factor [bacterium]
MSHTDARTEGRGDEFPSTRWSRIAPGSNATHDALEELAQRYWRPAYAYVRARWAKSDDDARDAVQDFFLWIAEGDFLARADPERGSFRGFIKASLANFLHDLERKRRTVKRGGGKRFVPLDAGDSLEPPAAGASPEEALDDAWRRELLAQAIEALEAEMIERDKPVHFAVFRDFYLDDEELDYEKVAARHGITKVDVSNWLAVTKKRYRAHLRAAVLETVRGDADLRVELAWLFEGHEE